MGGNRFVRASWSPQVEGGINTNNTVRDVTSQLPWRANCFAIYGGADNTIGNQCCHASAYCL
jgi:hypothetical protein